MAHNVLLIQSKPGLGKSTLAKSVVNMLRKQGIDAERLSLGDQLRGISSGDIESAFSDRLAAHKDLLDHNGTLDDPDLIHGIVSEALDRSNAKIMVLDGHPRYQRIVPGFIKLVEKGEINLLKLVILDGTDQFAIERMHDRDRELSGVAENAAERLATHQRDCQSAIDQLERRYGALHIDATRPLEEKTAAVVSCINLSSLL
jgi:adenylate kinase family enzyme